MIALVLPRAWISALLFALLKQSEPAEKSADQNLLQPSIAPINLETRDAKQWHSYISAVGSCCIRLPGCWLGGGNCLAHQHCCTWLSCSSFETSSSSDPLPCCLRPQSFFFIICSLSLVSRNSQWNPERACERWRNCPQGRGKRGLECRGGVEVTACWGKRQCEPPGGVWSADSAGPGTVAAGAESELQAVNTTAKACWVTSLAAFSSCGGIPLHSDNRKR